MIWWARCVPCRRISLRDGLLGDAAALLVADDRHAVDLRDVHGVARGVRRTRCRRPVRKPWLPFSEDTVGLQAGLGQVGQRGQHAAVDLAGADVLAAAPGRSRSAGRPSTRFCSAGLGISMIWPIEKPSPPLAQGVAARGAVDRRWPRAASSRPGSAWGRSTGRPCPRGGWRTAGVRALRGSGVPTVPERGAGHDLGARLEAAQLEALGVELDRAGVVVVGADALALHLQQLVRAAGVARLGHRRVGEQALLDRGGGLRRPVAARRSRAAARALRRASLGWRPADAGRGGRGPCDRGWP